MIEPNVPPLAAAQPVATQPSAAGQAVEAMVDFAIEGGVEAIAQSGDLVGTAVVAGVGAVGSLFGGFLDSL